MSEASTPLNLGDTFYFSCHPGLDCFTQCCQDVNILLTPYEIVRMKKRLALSSTEFLQRYTKTLIAPETALPAVQLRMDEENSRRCHFVGEQGCGVYEDRPWSCRMYPIGSAPAKTAEGQEEYYQVAEEGKPCLGLKEAKEWTVEEWLIDQGVDVYNK